MTNYNPRDIKVDVIGEGFYVAKDCAGNPVHVPSPSSFASIHDWTLDLDDTQLEAGLQMFYDRWNFQSGEECDRLAFEALVLERKRRYADASTFAPGIFR